MNEKTDDDFFDTIFTFASVIRTDINHIQALKRFLRKEGITVCYQKTSTQKLFITEINNDKGGIK